MTWLIFAVLLGCAALAVLVCAGAYGVLRLAQSLAERMSSAPRPAADAYPAEPVARQPRAQVAGAQRAPQPAAGPAVPVEAAADPAARTAPLSLR